MDDVSTSDPKSERDAPDGRLPSRADAEAANIYARVYNLDPEFYRFRKSMEVLNATMGKETVVLLATDGELLRYLENSK